jgi:hypothetical protein
LIYEYDRHRLLPMPAETTKGAASRRARRALFAAGSSVVSRDPAMTLPIDRSPPLPRADAVAAKPKPDHAAPSARMPFYAWLAPLLAVALVGASAMLGLQSR